MLIKIVLGLGFWSFLIIGLMKLQGHFSFAGVRQNALVPVSRPVTKQNHSKPVGTTTPATTERVYPNDVLIDTRPGKYYTFIKKISFIILIFNHE